MAAELEEPTLVARARRGDVDAYEDIVRRHQQIAFRVAFLITGSAEEAEEAAQDGFMKAYRALGRFDPKRPLRPWLLKIVANEARNRRRAAGRRRHLVERAAAETLPPAVAAPETAVLAGEDRDTLLAALAALDQGDREVLFMRFLADLSEADTAAALGCRLGTVKSRTSRALGRLRTAMGDAGA